MTRRYVVFTRLGRLEGQRFEIVREKRQAGRRYYVLDVPHKPGRYMEVPAEWEGKFYRILEGGAL